MAGVVFLGRWFISGIFIILAVSSFFHLEEVNNEFLKTLWVWQMSSSNLPGVQEVLSFMEDFGRWFVLVGVVIELFGALAIFLQFHVKIGATLLLSYLFFTTLFHQPFWFFEGPLLARSFVLFMKNFAIVGGLMLILAERRSAGVHITSS